MQIFGGNENASYEEDASPVERPPRQRSGDEDSESTVSTINDSESTPPLTNDSHDPDDPHNWLDEFNRAEAERTSKLEKSASGSAELEFSKRRGRVQRNPYQITNIRKGVKDETRVNIYLGGRFSFSLTQGQLKHYDLRVGQVLDEAAIDELRAESDYGKLYQRTIEYVMTRPHSVKEVREHLRRRQIKREIDARRYEEFQAKLARDPEFRAKIEYLKEREKQRRLEERFHPRQPAFTQDEDGGYTFHGDYSNGYEANNENEYGAKNRPTFPHKPGAPVTDATIERVITQLLEQKFLDDRRYAESYVRSRYQARGISNRRLYQELVIRKGVDPEIVKSVLAEDEFGDKPRDDEVEIRKLVAKKRRLKTYQDDFKLIRYLVRQGFDYTLAQRAVTEATEEAAEEAAENTVGTAGTTDPAEHAE